MTIFASQARWRGHRLVLPAGRLLAVIEPDSEPTGLYRVRFPDGEISDVTNLTRAKDAAIVRGLAKLNGAP